MSDNQQFGFLDMITIFTAILQTMDYELTVKQASNDDILRELKKDMAVLQDQNREIIEFLTDKKSHENLISHQNPEM